MQPITESNSRPTSESGNISFEDIILLTGELKIAAEKCKLPWTNKRTLRTLRNINIATRVLRNGKPEEIAAEFGLSVDTIFETTCEFCKGQNLSLYCQGERRMEQGVNISPLTVPIAYLQRNMEGFINPRPKAHYGPYLAG